MTKKKPRPFGRGPGKSGSLLRTDPYKDLFVYLEQAPSAGFDVRLMTSVGEVFFDVPDELAASMREGAESTNQ